MPLPGFNTWRVKGLVTLLLVLMPEDHGKSMALKITAGGKLHNVVVEDEHIGKVLKHSGIKKCVTLISLNKILAFNISTEVRVIVPLSIPGY